MKNMIKVLPELDVSNMDTYIKAFCEMMECARTTNDIPDSIEDYFHIDYMDRKMLMKNNIRFFNDFKRNVEIRTCNRNRVIASLNKA